MNLIIIPCCGTKNPGGQPTYSPPSSLLEIIGPSLYQQLLASRRELSRRLGLPPGPDLGFEAQAHEIRYLPAYQRYNGIIYRTSRFHQLYKPGGRFAVVIVSALYGLIEASDLIRDYNLAMSDSLSSRRLHTWWQQRGLGEILCTYAKNQRPDLAHDLLSGNYRRAVKPWPSCAHSYFPVHSYSYPGQGTGSNYRRGEDLETLLRG